MNTCNASSNLGEVLLLLQLTQQLRFNAIATRCRDRGKTALILTYIAEAQINTHSREEIAAAKK